MRTLAFVVAGALLAAGGVYAAEEAALPNEHWSFEGPFGTYDRGELQRGFQVYQEVCSVCHAVEHLAYRDLTEIGYSEDEVKAMAAQAKVTDGPNDQGEMFERPGRPSDPFVRPFPNEKAARAANNGALPPDQSLLAKSLGNGLGILWGTEGPDYIYALLTGYKDPPAGEKLPDNQYYDVYFPTHHIAMPPPLSDDVVTFGDGTKATTAQEAHDVVTFLTWAAEPKLEARKSMGAMVIFFLLFMTVILYLAKRKIWANVH